MIATLSYEQAIENCPAIAAKQPSSKVSSRYNFISTDDIVKKALDNDWLIRSAKGGKGVHGLHNVTLVHKSQVTTNYEEGFPQVVIVNSHNLSKRFSLSMGYFRLICSNGLIAPSGMTNSIKPSLHRPGILGSSADIVASLDEAFKQYEIVGLKTESMKERVLSEQEKLSLARFAYYIRFRYRMMQPKKIDVSDLLKPRRPEDEKDNLWTTFNVIQENISRGGSSLGRGITQFQDDLRFNQELWAGADCAITHRNENLDTTLKNLFPKREKSTKVRLPESN
jgi:hypothetical protein